METPKFTIKEYRRNVTTSDFESTYNRLQLNQELSDLEINHLLKNAIIFSNYGDEDLQKLGYKILVGYSNKYSDYKPLYDFSVNKGYYPTSKFIENKYFEKNHIAEHFFGLYFSSFHENYKEASYYISNGQKKLIEFSSNHNENVVIVAPTSYGKSEIIVKKVFSNLGKKICIVVPSKALLAQTKKRLLNHLGEKSLQRVITHPEMYKGSEVDFVAVLTQERLLRLLQKNPELKVDLVLIDEAHNLFGEKKDDSRSTLLGHTLIILKSRNKDVVFNFFSPFISNPQNLKIRQSKYELSSQNTNEYIKTEKYFLCDVYNTSGELNLYEQFSNSIISTGRKYANHIELLNAEHASKNIIYLNRPKHIEEFAIEYTNALANIGELLPKVISTIADFLHPDYNLIKCIKKGIVYHHGGMPEIIRLYVEDIFSRNEALKFIITSSTLLEGVNIPAQKMFLLSTKKGKSNLTVSQFKNLIGRINRFSEIFNPDTGNLNLLEPNIYIVKSKYESQNANIETFIKSRARTEVKIEDNVNNLLLKEEETLSIEEREKLRKSLEYLENIEPNATDLTNVDYVQSDIAKLCFKNNVYDFNIKDSEKKLNENLSNYKNSIFPIITTGNQLLEAINAIFFNDIIILDDNIKRLQNAPARRFYAMILEWRSSGTSFKQMIASFIGYWDSLRGDNLIVFIGEKWGEDKRNSTDKKPLYVDLRKKDSSQKINLAILKIKEEQDFVEFNLLKYIDILAELELIQTDFYDKIKYGSSDRRVITLLKNGFSIELAKCVTKSDYSNFITIIPDSDEIVIQAELINQMIDNSENDILIFEIRFHVNEQR